jgi:hypothetical protein
VSEEGPAESQTSRNREKEGEGIDNDRTGQMAHITGADSGGTDAAD